MSWIREPLVHFLLLGAVLFVISGAIGGTDRKADDRIVVGIADVERFAMMWEAQWNRPPTPEELRGVLEDHIKQEVLFREAIAMGLDRDDTVIRRRLVQKMEFLSADLADQIEPTEAEVEAWFQENVERYQAPAGLSFTHVYFSTDARGGRTAEGMDAALATLRADPTRGQPWLLGDRFMLPHEFDGRSVDDIDRQLGAGFAASLMALERGVWSGPVESGFGLHLVLVYDRVDARAPDLADVRRLVDRDMASERRAMANDAFYQQLRSRYEVTFDEDIQEMASMTVDEEDER